MNRIALTADLLQRGGVRYTPAGIAVTEAVFRHEGTVIEAGIERHLCIEIDTIAMGGLAQRLQALNLGASVKISGFVAPRSKRSRKLRVHITDFELGA